MSCVFVPDCCTCSCPGNSSSLWQAVRTIRVQSRNLIVRLQYTQRAVICNVWLTSNKVLFSGTVQTIHSSGFWFGARFSYLRRSLGGCSDIFTTKTQNIFIQFCVPGCRWEIVTPRQHFLIHEGRFEISTTTTNVHLMPNRSFCKRNDASNSRFYLVLDSLMYEGRWEIFTTKRFSVPEGRWEILATRALSNPRTVVTGDIIMKSNSRGQ